MTKTGRTLAIGVLVGGLALPATAGAGAPSAAVTMLGASGNGETARPGDEPGESPPRASQAARAPQTAAVTPVFVPRARRGAPAARVGGATRGRGDELVVRALVPRFDDAAIALAEDQTLYWHLSARTTHPVNFTLTDPQAIDPILDVTLEGPFEAGIHAVDVFALQAKLEVGRRYEWYVAVMPDPERRSADIMARGVIQRVAEPALLSRLEGSTSEQAALLLAEQGIWYDTLNALARQIAASPGDPAPLAQRSALLSQVGLELAATGD